MDTYYGAAYISQTQEQQHIRSGNWLAWAKDTAAHYTTIHCHVNQTTGLAVQLADIPASQTDTLSLYPQPTPG